MLDAVKHRIKRACKAIGLEVSRVSSQKPPVPPTVPRSSMEGCLRNARRNGLHPNTVIDVGAAEGTPVLYSLFPKAHHLLIDPLKEFQPALEKVVANLQSAEYILAAATSEPGNVIIHVHPDLYGSSVYKEEEDSDVNGVERLVPAVTLEQLCQEKGLSPPYLLKIDVQGAEQEVLKGAQGLLSQMLCIILETSLFETLKGAPLFHEMISYMYSLGFVAYDAFDSQYRLLDGAMSQIDIAFVPEKSVFRQYHFYATREQRAVQTKFLQKHLKNSL